MPDLTRLTTNQKIEVTDQELLEIELQEEEKNYLKQIKIKNSLYTNFILKFVV